jgi:hypothetical protein
LFMSGMRCTTFGRLSFCRQDFVSRVTRFNINRFETSSVWNLPLDEDIYPFVDFNSIGKADRVMTVEDSREHKFPRSQQRGQRTDKYPHRGEDLIRWKFKIGLCWSELYVIQNLGGKMRGGRMWGNPGMALPN